MLDIREAASGEAHGAAGEPQTRGTRIGVARRGFVPFVLVLVIVIVIGPANGAEKSGDGEVNHEGTKDTKKRGAGRFKHQSAKGAEEGEEELE